LHWIYRIQCFIRINSRFDSAEPNHENLKKNQQKIKKSDFVLQNFSNRIESKSIEYRVRIKFESFTVLWPQLLKMTFRLYIYSISITSTFWFWMIMKFMRTKLNANEKSERSKISLLHIWMVKVQWNSSRFRGILTFAFEWFFVPNSKTKYWKNSIRFDWRWVSL